MTGWIINFRISRCGAFCTVLFSTQAGALGFGELTLHSRIGEPLRAEVSVHGSDHQEIENACFSLPPLPAAELPVVTLARTRLTRNGREFRLLIIGSQPISEPVFMIGLRASCGVDLQRDYVLMPEAPLMQDESRQNLPIAAVEKATGQKLAKRREQPADDTEVPAEKAAPSAGSSRAPGNAPPSAPRPKKTISRNTLAELGMKGGDRVLLSAEPDSLPHGELALAPRRELTEMDDRMLRLETSLHSLNQQVDSLSTALEVTAETAALRQKLQAAQAEQSRNDSEITVKARAPTSHEPEGANLGNWLELLLSALAGGCISGGIAHLLSRRRSSQNNEASPVKVRVIRRKTWRQG